MNANPSRLGQINAAGDDLALFLKVFAGEVLTSFDTANVMMPLHYVRSITHGKSAQFPATGLAEAYNHTPGERLAGRSIRHAERVITIDSLLVSDVFIANIDEAMNHYDVRSIYSHEVARALAKRMDRNILQTLVLAARSGPTVTGNPGGSTINAGANVLTNASGALRDAIFAAGQTLDEKDVPDDNRWVVLRPAQYWRLFTDALVPNRDYSAAPGADVRTGKVMELGGIKVVKSNNVPSTNITTGNAKYQGNFTNTVAVVFDPSAVGTVKLMDLAVEGKYEIELQGTLIVARYACGHGILRPESAVEITSANP